jgi:predicted TIM-barrel fold metal-dependent hydrolase
VKAISACGLSFVFLLGSPSAFSEKPWIIDPHTHFKGAEQIELENRTVERDPRNTLGHVVVPEDYRKIADHLGIQATLVVEAVDQSHPQFNDWMLTQAESDLVCGYIARGNLASKEFSSNYRRYKQTGHLNGFRFRFDELHGYLDGDLARGNLGVLQSDSMVVDLLIEPKQSADVVRLAKDFPQLKIVINHCFRAKIQEGQVSDQWKSAVIECSKYPNVYCKISSIINFAGTEPFTQLAPSELATYLPVLEPCFDAFGEDRVIFATNWGVSSHFGPVDDVVRIVKEFLGSKGEAVMRKGMRENAIRVYGIDARGLR